MILAMVALMRNAVSELQLRNQMRRLRAIDDHMLADMGLTRGTIEFAVRNGQRDANR